MEINRAQQILKEYESVLGRGTEGDTVLRKISTLPFSKAMVKFAYFTVIEDAIKNKIFNSDVKENIIEGYTKVNTFVDDALANKYAKIYADWQQKKSDFSRSKKDETVVKQYLNLAHVVNGSDLLKEIDEFIKELN